MELKEPSAKYLHRAAYKQTEAGMIPDDWDLLPLSALCHTICDGTHFTPRYVVQGIPFYSVENVTANDFANTKFISESEHALLVKRCRPERGDILMTRIGSLGDTKLLDWEVNASIYVSLALLKPNARINANYLYRYSKSKAFVVEVEKRSLLNASPKKINMGNIGAVPIPVPRSVREQEAIAGTLTDSDALIESLDQLVAKKRQIKQGAMQELLPGKRRLPGFNGKWKTKQIGEFAECTSGGTPSTLMPSYWSGPVRWMSSGELNLKNVYEVEGRITEEGLRNSNAKMLPAKSVLIGLAGQGKTRGTAAMNLIELCTNQSIAAILPNASFDSRYLYYNLDSRYRELRDLSTGGGGRGGLNLTIIRTLEVPFPELSEQLAIGSTLFAMDEEISALEAKLAKARMIKQSMMQQLLTGKIRLL